MNGPPRRPVTDGGGPVTRRSDALDAETEVFEALFDLSPDVLVVVGLDGTIELVNDRVEDVFGYRPGKLEGEEIETLVPSDIHDEHVALRDRYLHDPERRPMGAGLDLQGEHRDGTTFPVDVMLSPLGDLGVLAVIRDVTERRRLQRERQTALEKYRTLIETVPDAVVVADTETGTIVEANESAATLFGTSRDALVGLPQVELHPEGEADRYRDLFERHTDDGGVMSRLPDGSDIFIERADGERVPVEINARTATVDGDSIVLGSFRDISERRAYERELVRRNARLEDFTAVLSHDLRNPLTVAKGHLELAMQSGDDAHLEDVASAHERMTDLVEDVLGLAQAGQSLSDRTPVGLGRLVEGCWTFVDTSDATLRLEADVVVDADESRLRQLLENLFRNAVEHGGDDVTVTVGPVIGDTPEESGFYVEDDGSGIPADRRDEVFESGFTTNDGGTGLGLSIVSEVADAHGWHVSVTESDAGGARFEVTCVDCHLSG